MGSEIDQLGAGTAEVGATDSCRVDWISNSYFAASRSLQRSQIAFFAELNHLLSGTYVLSPGGGRRFFEESWYHECGIALKWTEPDADGVNRGLLSVDIKGDALAALPADVRKALYLDMQEIEGFKQCTRLDMQRTVVNPHATAQEVYRRVVNREVWIKGFTSYGQAARLDGDGNPVKGCTLDWGSRKGTTQCSTYDKRAELKGVGDPATRHELRHRKQPARDRYSSLCSELREEGDVETSTAEEFFVKSNLAQAMTYLDTSRLKDIPRDQWPANWARDSKPADFWAQVVSGEVREYQTQWRYERTLERLIKNRSKQYGRGRCKYTILRVFRDGESLADVIQDDLDLDFVRLKDEDIDEVISQVPDERKEEAYLWARDARAKAARNIEDAHNAL